MPKVPKAARRRTSRPDKPAPKKAAPPPLRLEWRSPAELAENPKNWRRHPEAQVAALSDVIGEVGWAGACLFNEATGRLIDGHARRKVALDAGTDRIPVLVGSWSEADEAKILSTLDPLAAMATADAAALDALLRDVATGSQAVGDMLTRLAEEAKVIPRTVGDVPSEGDAEPAETEEAGDFEEDDLDLLFKSPYPWFGGKARVAGMVWKRFGGVQSYIEPFFGSGAVFLNRPQSFTGTETINDFDGFVANFWRAVQSDPDAVAAGADWPVNENDLHARHAWLVGRKETLQAKLEGDPEWFDAKVAGWWVWGMSLWIGSGFCAGLGPWRVVDGEDGSRQLVHLGNAGRGVNRQLVHLGNAGRGEPQAGRGERGLLEWIRALAERMRRVRVCCGDWSRVCGGKSGDSLAHFFSTGEPVGIFLDPPYADTAGRSSDVYNRDDLQVAHAVREWCIRHGDDTRLRICLAGYEGEHKMPPTWEAVRWKAQGGMAGVAKGDSAGKANRFRERLWFSPHCLKPGA